MQLLLKTETQQNVGIGESQEGKQRGVDSIKQSSIQYPQPYIHYVNSYVWWVCILVFHSCPNNIETQQSRFSHPKITKLNDGELKA